MQQTEALPGPSLDQWHRAAEEDEDGPGTVLPGVQGREGPLPEAPIPEPRPPPPPCHLTFQS